MEGSVAETIKISATDCHKQILKGSASNLSIDFSELFTNLECTKRIENPL